MDTKKVAKVCAVIVTYNRKKYLMTLLKALGRQSQALHSILIFDNFSDDGTQELLKQQGYCEGNISGKVHETIMNGIVIYYYRNTMNSGGSGGFHDAIQIAMEKNPDFIWAMDDDVIPEEDCLKNLLTQIDKTTAVCIPNRTTPGFQDYAIIDVDLTNPFKFSVDGWKNKLLPDCIEQAAVYVKDMAFEGPLFRIDIIKDVGLPKADLFILFDDSEYALRISEKTNIKFVKNAKLYKQIIPMVGGQIPNWKIYYNFRNAAWFIRTYGKTILVRKIRPLILCTYWAIKYLLQKDVKKTKLIIKAYRDGTRSILGKNMDL